MSGNITLGLKIFSLIHISIIVLWFDTPAHFRDSPLQLSHAANIVVKLMFNMFWYSHTRKAKDQSLSNRIFFLILDSLKRGTTQDVVYLRYLSDSGYEKHTDQFMLHQNVCFFI